ncbi:Polypeptide N-acetylgalactosaminyltransferase 5, partial [Pseudolycoriella hygida]
MNTRKVVLLYAASVSSLLIVFTLSKIYVSDTTRQSKPAYHQKLYPKYYVDKLNTEWKFKISKLYDESSTYRWTETVKSDNVTRHGIGEGGAAFKPPDEHTKELMEEMLKKENYNLLASNMMSLHRSLPDSRHEKCKELDYPEKLPNASVIIIFHDEAWTTILRTVWSVIERSPRELINEIVLVDDQSSVETLKRPLDDYVEQISFNVKIIRTSKREGLIRARLIGARYATGSVLIFLDAHMECSDGWLPPLLARIASDRSIKTSSENLCFDIHPGNIGSPLSLRACHQYGGNQLLFLTKDEMIITRRSYCVGVNKKKGTIMSVGCTFQDSHWWTYNSETKWLVHTESGKCMQAVKDAIVLGQCGTNDDTLSWDLIYTNSIDLYK